MNNITGLMLNRSNMKLNIVPKKTNINYMRFKENNLSINSNKNIGKSTSKSKSKSKNKRKNRSYNINISRMFLNRYLKLKFDKIEYRKKSHKKSFGYLYKESPRINNNKLTNEINISDVSKLYRGMKGIISLTNNEIVAGDIDEDGMIKINDVSTLYRYVKGITSELGTSKIASVTFTIQDKNASSETIIIRNCQISQSASNCTIIVPTITVNDGYTLVGWSKDSSATSTSIKSGDTISISNDTNEIYF